MMTICQRELRALFRGLWGWIYIAGMCLAFGIAASYYSFYGGSVLIPYILIFGEYAVIPLIPCLCAAVGSRDRRDGSDAWLRTLPLSTAATVGGKYLALLYVMALPLGILCLLPVLFSLYGAAVDMAASYVAIGDFFLLCAALAAVCLFLSSLTGRWAVACVAGVTALLLLFFLPLFGVLIPIAGWISLLLLLFVFWVAAVGGWLYTRRRLVGIVTAAVLTVASVVSFFVWPDTFVGSVYSLTALLSPFTSFEQAMMYGILDLNTLLLLLSMILLFLFCTGAVMERRRLPEGGDRA